VFTFAQKSYSILLIYHLQHPYVNAAIFSKLFKLHHLNIFTKFVSLGNSCICEYVAPNFIVIIFMTITAMTVAVVHQWTNHMVPPFGHDSTRNPHHRCNYHMPITREFLGTVNSTMILTWSWHFEECWQGLVEHWTRVSHERPVKCGRHSQLLPIHVPPFLQGTAAQKSSSEARSQCAPTKHHAQRMN